MYMHFSIGNFFKTFTLSMMTSLHEINQRIHHDSTLSKQALSEIATTSYMKVKVSSPEERRKEKPPQERKERKKDIKVVKLGFKF